MNLTNIINKLYSSKWAMEKKSFWSFYDTIENFRNIRIGGLKGLLMGDPLLTKQETTPPQDIGVGDVAIINVSGILTKGPSEMEQQVLGLVDIDDISNALDEVSSDPSISKIVLSFASPGGETTGITELGRKIKTIDKTIKPVYSWTEVQMCSAAAWLGTQARMIGMTESSNIGSCGVYIILPDASEKYKQEGINMQVVSSGKWKMIGHDMKPLSDEEREYLQNDVNAQHQLFKDVVKSNRPNIKDESLEGLSYEGIQAKELGWCDIVVDSLEEFLTNV